MSLVRAFTRRVKRNPTEEESVAPIRTISVRKHGEPIDRGMISSPVALLSTTNMLSYNAPDIGTVGDVSSSSSSVSSSQNSAEDSDASSTSRHSRETLTDASSIESSPSSSPEPNHLSCYFESARKSQTVRRSMSTSSLHQSVHQRSLSVDNAPAVPRRAISHSKKAHERLARKRSLQHMAHSSVQSLGSWHSHSRNPPREHRTSLDIIKSGADPAHPFGKELEQLNEIVEEFSDVVRDAEMEEDVALMQQKGLMKFCAADYMSEIQPLFAWASPVPLVAVDSTWI